MESQKEESRRPKQGPTEERVAAGVGGVKARCPLLDAFANDREILALSVDAESLREVVRNGCYSHPACWCPLCWPQAIMCCIPCIRFGLLSKCQAAAAAHHLILCEHSLKWVVDPYPLEMRSPSASFSDFPLHPSCHQLCHKEQLTTAIEVSVGVLRIVLYVTPPLQNPPPFLTPTTPFLATRFARRIHIHVISQEVFPLSEVESVEVLDCLHAECGKPVAAQTLVVKLVGLGCVCAVDAPSNGHEFAQAVMKRVEECKSAQGGSPPLPEQWEMYKQVTLRSF